MNGNDPLLSALKCAAVAILFAACGALSSFWLLPDFPDHWGFLFPLPFALLCTVLFMRKAEAVLALALAEIVWLISSCTARVVVVPHLSSYLPGFVGGSIGGLGLVLCTVICHPSLFSWKRVAYGGLVGSIAGLAFGPWTQVYMVQHYGANIDTVFPRTVPILAFAIWQAAMSTYLYALCTQVVRKRVAQPTMEPSAKL